MTPRKCSALIKKKLEEYNLTYQVTARTVSLSDLARESKVFVTIHSWETNDWKNVMLYPKLNEIAEKHGFFLDFE